MKKFSAGLFFLLCLVCTRGRTQDAVYASADAAGQATKQKNASFFYEKIVFPNTGTATPNYRIPALIQGFNGDLLLFAEKRMCSIGDVGYKTIILTRSKDFGKTWLPEETLFSSGYEANSYPTTLVDTATKTIWLFFLRDLKEFYVMKSTDDGFSWSAPRSIHKQVTLPEWDTFQHSQMIARSTSDAVCEPKLHKLKNEDWEKDWKQRYGVGAGNAAIRLSKGLHAGRLMVPARHIEWINEKRENVAHFFYSDDNGESWHVGKNIINPMGNEAQLIELANGDVMMNSRAQSSINEEQKNYRLISISHDGGDNWEPQYADTALIEPTCHASVKRLSLAGKTGEKNRLIFSNPKNAYRTKKHPYGRINMTVRLSYDEGKTWTEGKEVYPYNASYSDLAVLKDHSIAIVYERGKSADTDHYWDQLVFARFNIEWLTDNKDSIGQPER